MKRLARAVPWSVGSHVTCRRALSTTFQLCRSRKKNSRQSRLPIGRADSPDSRRPFSKPRLPARTDSVGEDIGRQIAAELVAKKRKYTGRLRAFWSQILRCFQIVVTKVASSSQFSEDDLATHSASFMAALENAFSLAEKRITRHNENPLYFRLRDALVTTDVRGLARELHYSFHSSVTEPFFSKDLEDSLQRIADFRFPHEWFPATRTLQRTVHLHVGPTNSGKTYNALKALERSKRGAYAGPLRLLANEVYQRLTAKGYPCALITGEEVRIPHDTDQYFSSCTVEMMPLNVRFDVAVIDEIQMLSDQDRGNGWTVALLGVQAKELHVCGEERAVPLVQALCASVGDKCIVHRYQRLSPLETMATSLNSNYDNLQKGDAIIAFSRLSLYAMKRNIERHTGRRCAIIYGSLPPEVRVQQAALFNDPDNDYDFVVASDAIGMGLNLEIRRVILESLNKFDGAGQRMLSAPEIKQIGGRAGRYRTPQSLTQAGLLAAEGAEAGAEKIGYVTTVDRADLKCVKRAFEERIEDLRVACIDPPAGIVERYASYFPPGTPLSFLLMRIKATAAVGSRFEVHISETVFEIADILQDIPLTIHDRLTFCYIPIMLRAEGAVDVLRALARVVAENSAGDLLSIDEIPLEYLDLTAEDLEKDAQQYLTKLESLHSAINQYVWLSYRFSGVFRSQTLAFHVRSLVEERLIQTLERLDFTEEQLSKKRSSKRQRMQSRMMDMDQMATEEGKVLEQEPAAL